MLATMSRALAAFMLLSQATAVAIVPAESNAFCANIGDALHSDLEEHAAVAYCSSYLAIPAHTTTALTTRTIKKFKRAEPTANVHKHTTTAVTTTDTRTVHVFPSRTVTKTLYTSTSTIFHKLKNCPSPTSVQKRLEAGQAPSAFASLAASSLSDACKCLSIEPATRTVAASTVTELVELPHSPRRRAVTTISETVTWSAKPITRTATSDDYTTTVTITAVSDFKLLDGSSNQWAYINGYGTYSHLGEIDFNQPEDSAAEWQLTQSGALYTDGHYLFGYSGSGAFSLFVADHAFSYAPVPCEITRDSEGYCGMKCTANGVHQNVLNIESEEYPQWALDGKHFPGGFEAFPLYVVGGTT